MKSGSRLLTNSMWNAAAFVVGVGLNLLILPFVIAHLGVRSFGVAGLITACIAPALIFSGALGLMVTRELGMRLSRADRAEARIYLATALCLALIVGFGVSAIFALGGPTFARYAFGLTGDPAGDLAAAFYFGAAGWMCQCLAGVFLAMFAARQDYARLACVTISGTLISTFLILIIIPRSPHASTYIACQMAGFAGNLLLSAAFSRVFLADWLALPALHRAPLVSLFSAGKWQILAQSGGLVAGQADRYLLGIFLQPQNVGYYGISQRLEEAAYIGVLKIGEILFPFFSTLGAERAERVGGLFFRAAWVLNVLAVSVLGALIPCAGDLLHLWTDAEVAAEGQQVLIVLALAGILGSASNVFTFYLLAKGQTKTIAVISVVTAIFTLSTSSIVLRYIGWAAAGWSSCVGALAQIVAMTFLLRRSFDMPNIWARVWHFVLMPIVIGVACALLLRTLITGISFTGVALLWQVIFSYCISAAIIFAVVATMSSIGSYGAICRSDLRRIALRFTPTRSL